MRRKPAALALNEVTAAKAKLRTNRPRISNGKVRTVRFVRDKAIDRRLSIPSEGN
ncbi:MAG: hypothetical protein ACTS43_01810 [Candidatus Hodgkinia cicadicola]